MIKTAKPRWVQLFETLSPESQGRILSRVVDRVREIRNIGHGKERLVDLVAHPVHGLSVRKIPLVYNENPNHIKRMLRHNVYQTDLENHIRNLTKGGPGFAHRLGGSDFKSYYQYAGKREPIKDSFFALRDKLHALRASGKQNTQEFSMLKQQFINMRTPLVNVRPSKAQEEVLRLAKKNFPGLGDAHGLNMVNGKLVDVSPIARENVSDYLARKGLQKVNNPEILSRKLFLGSKLKDLLSNK